MGRMAQKNVVAQKLRMQRLDRDKRRVVARLEIIDAPGMTIDGVWQVADWLARQRDMLLSEHKNMSNKTYTAAYYFP